MIQRFAFLVSILFAPAFVLAQEPAPDLKDFSPETRKSYAETQMFIDQTESKMKLVRAQTDARAKEIEILANRVGKIISRMSSQGEDNSALQSEISVLNELLNLERQTTGDLRKENTRLTTAVDILKKERIGYEKLQIEKLRLKETELAGAQKRLNAALEGHSAHCVLHRRCRIHRTSSSNCSSAATAAPGSAPSRQSPLTGLSVAS